jgi:DNA-binding CsgD family transcriptional regulator
LIRDLHEGARLVPLGRFCGWVLEQLAAHLSPATAHWQMCDATTGASHVLERHRTSVDEALRGEVRIAWRDEVSRLTHVLALDVDVRHDDGQHVLRARRAQRGLELVQPHLPVALATSMTLALANAARGPGGAATAIVDRAGRIHALGPGFDARLRSAWPAFRGLDLPVELREACGPGHWIERDMHWSCESHGPFLLLGVQPLGPLARLTSRERGVVAALLDGRSYDDASRRMGISINTLRHAVMRVYRKLEVTSRLELALRVEGSLATSARTHSHAPVALDTHRGPSPRTPPARRATA